MNSMRDKMNNDEVILGAFLSEIGSTNILRIMKASGIQFIIADCEHGPFDYSQIASLAAIANGLSLPIIVRVPNINREHIQKYLDAGADGILAPMTGTADDVRELVKYGKYAPVGARGISLMRPHSEYNPGKLSTYMEKANQRVMLFVQIETQEGVGNAEVIASVEGLDGIFIGPNDLASDFGQPGEFRTANMMDAIDKVISASKKYSKSCGIITSDIPFIKECREKGMTLFSCNSEVGLLYKGASQMIHDFMS